MYITVDSSLFVDAFRRMGRKDQFSSEALEALFEYIENYEEDTGTRVELDVIDLCCEFTEYTTAAEAASDYGFTSEDEAREWLEDRTTVIDFDGGLIVQNF